jgi:signal transduction histidine kinase
MYTLTNERLIDYLTSNRKKLVGEWEAKVVVDQQEPCTEEQIQLNCNQLIDTLLKIFSCSYDETDEKIKILAIKVAKERAKSSSNIGNFVYNVNLGRSVIFSNLYKIGETWDYIQPAIDRINFCFDKFLHYAVSYYSEMKEQIIEEKNQFINSTHKDRLTLLGQMTSSFIHEFRNPLTSVQGFIQLIKSEHPDIKYLNIISNELEQLNFRVSQFLLLSKKELIGKEKTTFFFNALLEEVLIFLYPSILDSNVKIQKSLDQDIQLFGYADEIRQVLINIIFNAIDVLSTYRSDPQIELTTKIDDGRRITIHIANNGPMIPEELLVSIFEPFVTTKKLGTGLGLFVCREIIEKHKGTLECMSLPSKTVFTITLPLAKDV